MRCARRPPRTLTEPRAPSAPSARASIPSSTARFIDDEALDMMKARGTVFIPTLMATQGGREKLGKGIYPPRVEAKMRAAIEAINQTVKRAIAKGVIIGMGTDAAVYPHGRNPEEFHMLVDLGMTPIDALRAGTSVDAELLGTSEAHRHAGTRKAGGRSSHSRRPDPEHPAGVRRSSS